MARNFIAPCMAALCLATIHVSAQQPESSEARLRALGTVEAPGIIPVFYVPAAKERALRLQKSLQIAHAWYEKQFNIKVPILLAVIDAEMKKKVEDLRAWMYYPPRLGPRLIVMDSEVGGQAMQGADRDHAGGGILQGEHILFHDDGHPLAGGEAAGEGRFPQRRPFGVDDDRYVVAFVDADK